MTHTEAVREMTEKNQGRERGKEIHENNTILEMRVMTGHVTEIGIETEGIATKEKSEIEQGTKISPRTANEEVEAGIGHLTDGRAGKLGILKVIRPR